MLDNKNPNATGATYIRTFPHQNLYQQVKEGAKIYNHTLRDVRTLSARTSMRQKKTIKVQINSILHADFIKKAKI